MILLAAFNVLLYRYTRQTDLVIGTPVAGRQRTEIEGLIGLFVNSVIIRTEIDEEQSFGTLLEQVKETSLDALANQALPFEKLVMELQPDRDASYSPLFQVMFNLQSREQEQVPFAGLEVSPVIAEPGTAKFDLNVLLEDRADGLAAWFEYSTDLFDETTIKRMLGQYQRLLEAVVKTPDARIADLPLLDDAERKLVVSDWNQTAVSFPANATLISLFEAQVARKSEAIALSCGDENISYAELNARANQLGAFLRDNGVGPEQLVGVCMDRSIDMVVALYGILKAGGAYVPLDPEYPAQRLTHMVEDAQIELLLSQAASGSTNVCQSMRCTGYQPRQRSPDAAADRPLPSSDNPTPASASAAEHAAYVIFHLGLDRPPEGRAERTSRASATACCGCRLEYRLEADGPGTAENAVQLRRIGVGIFLAAA